METLQSSTLVECATDKAKKVEGLRSKAVMLSSRYVLRKCLAEGGTSSIYLAQDRQQPLASALDDNNYLALKCIHSSLLRADETRYIAHNEFSVARQLSHPRLIRINDLCHDERSGIDYLVMEYLPGDSLKSLISRNEFSYQQTLSVFEALVDVLSYMHAEGVVHSDLKPGNIMMHKGNLKLIDLANCRQDSYQDQPRVVVKSEHFFGYSLDYSSPQVIADEPASASDDVFSLACIVYEMLAGKSPVSASRKDASVSLSSVEKPKLINRFQWQVLKRAMSVDASQRYSSVLEFLNRFKRAERQGRRLFFYSLVPVLLIAAAVTAFGLWQTHWERYQHYQLAYSLQSDVQRIIADVRAQPALKRVGYLQDVHAQTESPSADYIVFGVQDDIVRPLEQHIREQLLLSRKNPDFVRLNSLLEPALALYPDSSVLSSARTLLAQEQALYADALLLTITESLESQRYTRADAVALSSALEQWFLFNGGDVKLIDTNLFVNELDRAIAQKAWRKVASMYEFADIVGENLPQLSEHWARQDASMREHIASLAVYYRENNASLERFPIAAGEYFFGAQLQNIQRSIRNVFYNKDIQRLAQELSSYQKSFLIPAGFKPYSQAVNVLKNKINDKIRFHNSKRQFKSATLLNDLKTRLLDTK